MTLKTLKTLKTTTLATLLREGADSRVTPDDSGLNRYGTSSQPRDCTPFGSCTASSPSTRAWAAAKEMREHLVSASNDEDLLARTDTLCADIREQIQYLLMLDQVPGTEVVLTPSGTDAELVVSYLACGDQDAQLVNIVVGPQEVGTGTKWAAGGLYFDTHVPSGALRERHTPLSGGLADKVDVITVGLRTPGGKIRTADDLDAQVTATVEQALEKGQRVLIHIVAHSKTGVHAPRLATASRLQRATPDDVMVVVDAAQGRISRRGLIGSLRAGFIVIITGSKFFGGPPFSGAVLVPKNFATTPRISSIPDGFGDFFGRQLWPETWEQRSQLRPWMNIGLLVRWWAALREMKAYYSCVSEHRYEVVRAFERNAPLILATAQSIELLSVYTPLKADDGERLLESKTTVFGFKVRRANSTERPYFNRAELFRIGQWLNQDLSGVVEGEALDLKIHLGQPVDLGASGGAALRVALGGPLVIKVASGIHSESILNDRIEWMLSRLRLLAKKLDVLAQNYEFLCTREDQ